MNQPLVLRDHNAHTAILVSEGPKWSILIKCAPILSSSREPTAEVRKHWKPYDYPVVKAAKKFLSTSYSVKEKAFNQLKEIIMQEQYSRESLEAMTEKELLEVMKKVTGSAPARLKPKSKGIDAILEAQKKELEAMSAKVTASEEAGEEKPKRSAAPKAAKAEGYKGHRPGSRKEQAHKFYDELKGDLAACLPKITALGIAESTAKSWCHAWKKA